MKNLIFLILVLVIGKPAAITAEVIGYLDYVIEDSDGFFVRGWACDKNKNASIDIHLYVNTNEQFVASGKANFTSENAISSLCGTSGIKHRFYIEIPGDNLREYQGQPITAYGISVSGNNNLPLKYSREIPTIPSSNIIGYLDTLYQKDEKFYIRGWACQKGINQSINVHAYVGSSAYEGGAYVFQGVADKELDTTINDLCNTVNVPHRFVIQIPESVMNEHRGKNIFVHGIRTSGGGQLNEELAITNTDKYTYEIPGPHPSVEEITDLDFHPLQYYFDANHEVITHGKVKFSSSQEAIDDHEFSLAGAHSIATNGGSVFFAANTVELKRDEEGNLEKDSDGNLIKLRNGAIVLIDALENKTIATHEISSSYPLFSPHDIIFNEDDEYYYYIDSHWYSPADYLVRFKNDGINLIDIEVIELNHLYPNQIFYARSLSISKEGNTPKIMIGVSSHGQVILVNSFSELFSDANFEVKKVTNDKRQSIIDTIGASGSYGTTGFVFNDVEYYKGYYYGTNYFRAEDCDSSITCADKFRLVRWKTWEDFEKDNIEDLSYLIDTKRVPYYMTNSNEKLYIATIPDYGALAEGEEMIAKIFALYSE